MRTNGRVYSTVALAVSEGCGSRRPAVAGRCAADLPLVPPAAARRDVSR